METRSNFGSQNFWTTKIRNDNEDSYARLPYLHSLTAEPLTKLRLDHVKRRLDVAALVVVAQKLFPVISVETEHTSPERDFGPYVLWAFEFVLNGI